MYPRKQWINLYEIFWIAFLFTCQFFNIFRVTCIACGTWYSMKIFIWIWNILNLTSFLLIYFLIIYASHVVHNFFAYNLDVIIRAWENLNMIFFKFLNIFHAICIAYGTQKTMHIYVGHEKISDKFFSREQIVKIWFIKNLYSHFLPILLLSQIQILLNNNNSTVIKIYRKSIVCLKVKVI